MSFPLTNGLLFVHMPKTAGTSFRSALAHNYTKKLCWYDYGANAPETTPQLKDLLYAFGDMHKVGDLLFQSAGTKPFCLAGHFSAHRYAPFFQAKNVITFFRNPVQRYISQYEHHCRIDGYEGSLEDFCRLSRYDNVQSKMVGSYPLFLLGFIGIQEHYQHSLEWVRDIYNLELEDLLTNVNDRQAHSIYQCDDKVLDQIRLNNNEDLVLYEQAKLAFKERWQLQQAGHAYTHGSVQRMTPQSLSGFASRYDSDEPVVVDVHINGLLAGRVRAKEDRPWLRGFNPGRYGYIGFNFNFEKPLEADDKVVCKVAGSGQVLHAMV